MTSEATFTWAGFWLGMRSIGPFAASSVLYGLGFGALAVQRGLTASEAVLMSALVTAGAAQYVALDAWAEPVPLVAVAFAALAMNTRYILLGASLRPWLGALPPYQSYATLAMLADGSWALAMRKRAAGLDDAAFLLGGGMVLYAGWVGATWAGAWLGRAIAAPEAFALDFMLVAFCAALMSGMWRGRADIWPLAAGAAAAVQAEALLPPAWTIILGGLAGSLVGALVHARRA